MIDIIILDINKSDITIVKNETLVCGSVNSYTVHLDFSDDWADLQKTAFFMSGMDCEPTIIDGKNDCIIPWEILTNYDKTLYITVYGTKPNGEIIKISEKKSLGVIKKGTECISHIHKPTPDVYDQILYNLDQKADRLFYDGKYLLLMCGEKILSSIEVYDENADGAIDDILIPTKLSEFINDTGFISEETDPTVPEWAKAENPPVYTAKDVGADERGTARTLVESAVNNLDTKINKLDLFKQDKLKGKKGQFVGFDEDGNAIAQDMEKEEIPVIPGPPGKDGIDGKDGESATIAIGSVTVGEKASVTNVGTNTHAILNFVLPQLSKEQINEAIKDAVNSIIQEAY